MAESLDPQDNVLAHVRVRNHIQGLIERESLPVGARVPSENELANTLGVSRMTVNRAVQALVRGGWLSREQGSGTFVARAATGVPLDRCVIDTGTPVDYSISNYYFGQMVATIRGRMSEHGVVVEFSDGRPIARTDSRTGYVAINPPDAQIADLRRLADDGGKVVVLGSTWPSIEDLCIDSDNVLGGILATQFLLDRGHVGVGFVGAFPEDSNTRDRLRGYRLALKSRGITAEPYRELVTEEDLDLTDEQQERYVRLLTDERTTALFAAGPRIAMRALMFAGRLGRTVPDDLSIVAYDDPDFVQLAVPPLTTVRQPLAAMASAACDRLLGVPPQPSCLDPEIVIRGTVAPAATPGEP